MSAKASGWVGAAQASWAIGDCVRGPFFRTWPYTRFSAVAVHDQHTNTSWLTSEMHTYMLTA